MLYLQISAPEYYGGGSPVSGTQGNNEEMKHDKHRIYISNKMPIMLKYSCYSWTICSYYLQRPLKCYFISFYTIF
jgi:hypothetical protein